MLSVLTDERNENLEIYFIGPMTQSLSVTKKIRVSYLNDPQAYQVHQHVNLNLYSSLCLPTHTAPPSAEVPTQGTALPQGRVLQCQTSIPGCTSSFFKHPPCPHQGLEYNQPGQSQELLVLKAVQMILIFSRTVNH